MKYPFYHIIKDYFRYSKTERISIFALIFLSICIFCISYFLRYQFNKAVIIDYPEIDNFLDSQQNTKKSFNKPNKRREIQLKQFEINTISFDELISMGFEERFAKQYIKYRQVIGGFKSVSQINKLYLVDDQLFNRIKPYAYLKPDNQYKNIKEETTNSFKKDTNPYFNTNRKYTPKPIFKGTLDLNSCDTVDLKKLSGIGSTLSNRIISYRNKLGGFVAIEQLKEVYGIKPEVYNQNKSHFILVENSIVKIDINIATYKTLWSHPYISKKLAYQIIKERYKGKYKDFNNFESRLSKIPDYSKRLLNYLQFVL